MAPLGKALDAARKTEYARLSGKDRLYIKGRNTTEGSPCGTPCCRTARTLR